MFSLSWNSYICSYIEVLHVLLFDTFTFNFCFSNHLQCCHLGDYLAISGRTEVITGSHSLEVCTAVAGSCRRGAERRPSLKIFFSLGDQWWRICNTKTNDFKHKLYISKRANRFASSFNKLISGALLSLRRSINFFHLCYSCFLMTYYLEVIIYSSISLYSMVWRNDVILSSFNRSARYSLT